LVALAAHIFGFSIIIGAFIAGVMLASLPYSLDIIGRVEPLKDFFATIFFVSLGLQMVMINQSLLKPLLLLVGLVILVKPLIITALISFFGYDKRVSFFSGLFLGQTSEFSLVIVTLGFYSLGHLSQEFFSLVVFLTVISIIFTSYVFKHSVGIYDKLSWFLSVFEKFSRRKKRFQYKKTKSHPIVIFGAHRIGNILVDMFQKLNRRFIIADHDPEIIEYFMRKKISCLYGDATNVEVLEELRLDKAKILISTIPDDHDNKYLIRRAKEINPKLLVFVTARHIKEAIDFYEAGADYVIVPHILGGIKVTKIVKKIIARRKRLKKIRSEHVKELLTYELFGL